ncbi:MAG: class I SAM-dependent methyltransferase [Deltaproteobacteria bacterium]|nr:class I SAM-dependent methyltransferase [Deltaproteobacteria bacterium]
MKKTITSMLACLVCGGCFEKLCSLVNRKTVNRCPNCGLRRLDPFPDETEWRHLYNRKEYYSENLHELHKDLVFGYDEKKAIIQCYKNHLQHIKSAYPPPARLLEIGCASGVFLDLAQKAGYEVSGIEVNKYAAEYATHHFGLKVSNSMLEEANLPANAYDIVVAFDVIEHVVDPNTFINKIKRLLRKGGITVIGTPNTDSSLHRLAEFLARASFGIIQYPLFRFYGWGKQHLHLFNPHSLNHLLASYHFEPIGKYDYGIPFENICDLKGPYRLGVRLLWGRPYEFTVLARLKSEEVTA